MACTIVYRCDGDDCEAQAVVEPLAGYHPEARVWLRYPEGWGWSADGREALCPSCLAAAEPQPETGATA